MKKHVLITLITGVMAFLMGCNSNAPKEDPGVKIEGKKGGEMKVDKDQLKIEGKRGGQLKIDSNGAKIEKP